MDQFKLDEAVLRTAAGHLWDAAQYAADVDEGRPDHQGEPLPKAQAVDRLVAWVAREGS